ncbi:MULTISPECIES: Panacea domain-containing protein [Vibrio]|uniref:Panacea domain-containing protein n=1 Tax=Vibrio TaxID=662 RepID=UPI000B5CB95F|nr:MULTISPECIES: type II toxin-antitoxin system antitoxin SocA domain-containing protein [Vibrio]HBV77625.1 DUF4065 domain-containing protein [Vibrio sp.]
MKAYHTYSAIDVAFSLLAHAKKQGKRFTNLQLQKLTYVSHGLSLSHFKRPLIIEDVYAWQYGPVVPSVYFRFKSFGSSVITDENDVCLDAESNSIIQDVVTKLGDYSGPQLVELTHRDGSPWKITWDKTPQQIIPDALIQAHYDNIQKTRHTTCL